MTVSMSGEMARPCSSRSSPTLTIAVMSSAGTTWMRPRRKRAAPTPPQMTATLIMDAPSSRWTTSVEAVEATRQKGHVGVDHHVHQFGERCLRLPSQIGGSLGRVADEQVDLGGS